LWLRLRLHLARWRERGLKRTNGILESQSVRFENFSRDAAGISDDGGEHDSAVNLAPAASPGSGGGCFKDAPYFDRDAKRILRGSVLRNILQHAGNDVGLDPLTADMARIEHRHGLRIVAEGSEQMLKRNLRRASRTGELGATSQGFGKLR
jgi:hypothetical protein